MNLKVNFIIGITLLTITSLCSCSKSPLCWGDDKNKGLIASTVNINQLNCGSQDQVDEKQYVIDSDEEYYGLISNYIYCDSSDLPEVDFVKYTLLGQYATGGCEVKFIREVIDNPDSKEYIYSIKVRDCGSCQSLRFDMNWVLVPKLPEYYNVRFEINH